MPSIHIGRYDSAWAVFVDSRPVVVGLTESEAHTHRGIIAAQLNRPKEKV
jgi:hypothetical protein